MMTYITGRYPMAVHEGLSFDTIPWRFTDVMGFLGLSGSDWSIAVMLDN